MSTIDDFTCEEEISHIDLLKIDTEGFDLEVLRGAQQMLDAGKISFVQVEVGFHPDNTCHVSFDKIRDFLFLREYCLFGLYEQQLEWTGEAKLRFANAVFFRQR